MSTEAWFREFERQEAMREERIDHARARVSEWEAGLRKHEAELEKDCVPLGTPQPPPLDPLWQASIHLTRSFECRSMMRSALLYDAGVELRKAGYLQWAELAECAADRIGGDDSDVRQLLFEVEAELSRRRRGAP